MSACRVTVLAAAAAMLVAGCSAREPLAHERAFAPGFVPPVSRETGRPVFGWGGAVDGANPKITHTPVIFVHGNTVDARFWLPARTVFRAAGYNDDELWAPTYGWADTASFDSNDLSVPTLDAFVSAVQTYIAKKTGRRFVPVDIVAHSLGVTVVRQWLTQTNRWHEVRNLVAVSGANHGVWTASMDARGPNRSSSFELAVGSPWLAQLNAGGEIAGATRTLTLYDGTGRYDVLFPPPHQDSPALAGATNRAFDHEASLLEGGYDHLALPRSRAGIQAILDFIRQAPEPLPQARPPVLLRDGDTVRGDAADTTVACTSDGRYPSAATAALPAVALEPGAIFTCYAHSARNGLASPMARFLARSARVGANVPLSLRATPAGGVHENPVAVTLQASDPAAMIVYSTAGTEPDSGAALYRQPVYVAAPLRLTAVAIAPDGRRSAPLRLDYDVSLERIDAAHTLERAVDPAAPLRFDGRNKTGN